MLTDMGMGTADDGDAPSGGDEGGASGDVNCLDSGCEYNMMSR